MTSQNFLSFEIDNFVIDDASTSSVKELRVEAQTAEDVELPVELQSNVVPRLPHDDRTRR